MSDDPAPRVVFDRMVFLQGAARRDGPAGICLNPAEAGVIRLLLSDALLAEIGDVLTRPVLRRKFPVLTAAFVEELLARLRSVSMHLADVPPVSNIPAIPGTNLI